MQLIRPVKTRFRCGYTSRLNLAALSNSLTHYAKGTRSQYPTVLLPQLVSKRFQVLFTPLSGVLFTFPSRYWFTIGCQVVFSLMRWSSQIPTEFLVFRSTWVSEKETDDFRLRGFHPLWPGFPACFANHLFYHSSCPPKKTDSGSRDPAHTTLLGLACARFGLVPVRSPLLGKSFLLSLPGGTKMFQFSPLAPQTYVFRLRCHSVTMTGSPIQTSPDQRLFSNSPKLIAAFHVFHRLLAPRHPPFALSSLATKNHNQV